MFHTLIYDPLYNLLVGILAVIPHADLGIAVILLTVIVKILLFPLAKQAIQTQVVLKRINPQLEELKETHKDDQQKQVKEMFALYKKHGVHPLSGFLTLLIQLPVIFSLYWIFYRGGFPVIDTTLLYSFVPQPESVSMHLFDFIDLTAKSIPLAFLAGATQFVHAWIAMEPPQTNTKPGESMKDDIMRSLHIQTRYILPLVIMFVAYTISAAVALYWTVSNLFTIGQEILVRRRLRDTQ